ncbi:MAG: hypothetical protein AAF677_17280 [Pseudomonadota bacterium]
MTRFIDDLDNSPARPTPSPAEVDQILDQARAMRGKAMAGALAEIGAVLARVVTARRLRPAGR